MYFSFVILVSKKILKYVLNVFFKIDDFSILVRNFVYKFCDFLKNEYIL